MRKLSLVLAVLAVTTAGTTLARQTTPPQQTNQRWQQDFLNNDRRVNDHDAKEWEHSYDRLNRKHIKDLPKIREHLAQSWQHFGMKPDAAKMVADAYVVEQPNLASPPTIRGKTDAEVAAMMQAALSSKQYLQADQILIQYERRRLHLSETPRN